MAVALALAALVLGSAEARASSAYVALGDSFTAGPLIPNQTGKPEGCARSDRNYPALVAQSIRPSGFRDVSCSSARTTHMTRPQRVPNEDSPQQNPPQFAALAPDIRLVTVGIGGNDIGF